MKALSIDIETTGLNKDTAEILEVGMVAFDTEVPFEGTNSDNSIRILLVKNEWRGEVFALNLNKEIISEILKVQQEFKDWKGAHVIRNYKNGMTNVLYNIDIANKLDLDNKLHFTDTEKITLQNLVDEFLEKNNFGKRITVAGKNFAGFDGPFLRNNPLFGDKFMSRFSHRVLDPGSMYVLPEDDQVPSLPLCLERAGFPAEIPHTSIEDAALVIKVIQAKLLG